MVTGEHSVVTSFTCEPKIKEYKQRVIEDVECKYDVIYVKYQCNNGSRGSTFSTLSDRYAERIPVFSPIIHFLSSRKLDFRSA
ncbi:hypothetical protein P3T76_016153 [Phytophthora citrophthora]|uniref:Uncharacterized protein n=1 Tax=Phytophthora citrophthora TaxID=4793 RepID=A0AAD9FY38_9STRA|nr:hypothetical protein P3T76_016153 [Phytophthora citrophthora]